MAAGLGFKTFTTGEVLTAADTNGYLMQGVLVFASAAARDAAITSPQEGQFAYLKDTNVTTYYTGSAWTNLDTTGMTNPMTTTGDMVYSSSGSTPARLGIGSTGQVITVAGGIPSWAAPATTATSYSLLNAGGTALTGSATITISSISGINKLFCIIDNGSSASGSSNPYIRLNGDTSSNYGYFNAIIFATPTIDNSASTDKIYFGAFSTNAASQMVATIEIDGCNSSGVKTITHSSGTTAAGGASQSLFAGSGRYLGTSTISSISFISGTGNWDAGTVYVYGA